MWYLACVGGGCLVGMAVMMLLLSEWVRLKIKEGTPSASHNKSKLTLETINYWPGRWWKLRLEANMITGRLMEMGTFTIDGEEYHGIVVETGREALKNMAGEERLYERVHVVATGSASTNSAMDAILALYKQWEATTPKVQHVWGVQEFIRWAQEQPTTALCC